MLPLANSHCQHQGDTEKCRWVFAIKTNGRIWPIVGLAVNVVFKLMDDEFLLGDGVLDQVADGDNANHPIIF